MASNNLNNKTGTDHRKTIQEELKEQFHVNNKCLDCVEELSKTFMDTLMMTLHLFSCLSSHKGRDDKDGRQIDWLVSVMVCQHDSQDDSWCFLKGNDLNEQLQNMKLKDNYETMRENAVPSRAKIF